MAASRIIKSLVVVPDEDPQPLAPLPGRGPVSIGISVPGQRVTWGVCLGSPYPLPIQTPPDYLVPGLRRTAREVLAPALAGRPLADFYALAEAVDEATELPAPEPVDQEGARDLEERFTAWVRPPNHPPSDLSQTESRSNERLVCQALRYGAGQALLEAAALAQGRSMAEVLAEAYGFPPPGQAVPLLVVLEGLTGSPVAALARQGVHALGFSVQENQPRVALGEDAAIVQRFLRQMKARLDNLGPDSDSMELHLDFNGALGRLFDQDQGKILGALFGLEQATSPIPLHVQDPVVVGDGADQQSQMSRLGSLIRLREMTSSLGASAWVDSLARVRSWLDAGAGDPIHINLARFGSLHQAALAVKACREQGVRVAFRGAPAGFYNAAPLACQFALATRPDLLVVDGPDDPIREEMGRALAGLKPNQG